MQVNHEIEVATANVFDYLNDSQNRQRLESIAQGHPIDCNDVIRKA